MIQRIIIAKAPIGYHCRVQIGDKTYTCTASASWDEAWHKAKTVVLLSQEELARHDAQQIAEEEAWNKVL